MYQEFFENTFSGKKNKSKKSVRFEMTDDNNKDSTEENINEDNIEQEDNTLMSTLEKRSARLSKHIAKLEEQAVSDNKPWALKGEVTAKDRPQNSLLEEAVEFDVCTRPGKI